MDNSRAKSYFRKIVKSPYLQFLVGVIMLISSLEGQQGTLYTDLVRLNIRIHHGVNLMGLWQVLQSLPNLLDSVSLIFSKVLEEEE